MPALQKWKPMPILSIANQMKKVDVGSLSVKNNTVKRKDGWQVQSSFLFAKEDVNESMWRDC